MTWSSISRGPWPGQSVKTMTWFSDRSGIASTGVRNGGADAPESEERGQENDEPAPADRERDDAVDHAIGVRTWNGPSLRELGEVQCGLLAVAAFSHASQQMKTTRPSTTTFTGPPIESSRRR